MKTFGLLIAAATLTLASAAHADSCSQQGVTRAATLALDANRSLSALPVSEDRQTDVSPAGRKAIAAIKDRLNDYTTAVMRCAPEKIAAADLKKTLMGFAGVELPEGHPAKKPSPDEASYGGDLLFDVRQASPDVIGVVARFGIPCGEDAMLMVFERQGNAWVETLRTQSVPYKTVAGGWGSFDYGISPHDKDRHWFVVTKTVAPWCSSTWSEIRYAVQRPAADAAHPRTLLSKTDSIWWDPGMGDLKVDATGFDLRWRAESMDGGVHNRAWIAHYMVHENRAYRVAPIAENPRDFADEWIRLDWSDAKNWTVVAAYGLKPLHNTLQKMHSFDYVSVRRCSVENHTQVEVEPTDSAGDTRHVFFQVATGQVLQMFDVSYAADPRCKGPTSTVWIALSNDGYRVSSKIASIVSPNTRAILKASGRLGSYLPVSIAFTDCRDTASRSARSA